MFPSNTAQIWNLESVFKAIQGSSSKREILEKLGINPRYNSNYNKLNQIAQQHNLLLPSGTVHERSIINGILYCPRCKKHKSLAEFREDKKRRIGYASYCTSCSQEYWSDWKSQTPSTQKRIQDWKARRREENRQRLIEYFKTNHCVDCGNSDPRVLVFDHVKGIKADGVAALITQGRSWQIIEAEIEKCEVRCYNCHAKVTQARSNSWLANLVV